MLNVVDHEEEKLRRKVNGLLLDGLAYPHMTNRYEEILEAHPNTFEWIFSDPKGESRPWSDFGTWLREDGGIYWINGKAGSGKSTLMKHIFDEPKTRKYLQQWCNSCPSLVFRCCIATFFFWNSGTSMQQSQQGLLSSLLFQVLGEHTNLIPIVFPKRWAELYNGELDLGRQITLKPWSITELYSGFEKLINQKVYFVKFCFFVDGLDEFSGDVEQLCMLFRRLQEKSNNVKFCLSSRPWVEFQQNSKTAPAYDYKILLLLILKYLSKTNFKEARPS
jgi:hypothetical protein